jgi:thiamine-phosphate pyrophosphorylase
MVPQLYLITPADADPQGIGPVLMGMLSAVEVSAILVLRGEREADAYADCVGRIVNIGQGAGAAVLVEDDVALARRLGADGVHVSGGPQAVQDAIAALKPDLIVGAGNIGSRHDAMSIGELGVDYLFFGPLSGSRDTKALDLAQWWAETFEVPAVLSDPEALEAPDARGAEFLALSTSLWASAAPADAIRTVAASLRETA